MYMKGNRSILVLNDRSYFGSSKSWFSYTFVVFLVFILTCKFEHNFYNNNENKKNKQILASFLSYRDAIMSKVEKLTWMLESVFPANW